MKEGNKRRITFWGIIFFITLTLSLIGLFSFLNGKGTSGSIRKTLLPIIENFNKSESLDIYKNVGIKIDAKYKNKGIFVTYSLETSTTNYFFEYKTVENENVLYTKYSINNETEAQIIIKALVDSISINLGYKEGEIFNSFNYDDFYETTISEGIKIIVNNDYNEVYLNLNNTLLKTISLEEINNKYIKQSDLTNIEYSKWTYTKGNYKLFIDSDDEKYIILLRSGKYNNDLYKSIVSIINSLPLNETIIKEFQINYPMLNGSKNFENYSIILDYDTVNIDFFNQKDYVIKIEIKKEIETEEEN